MSVNFSNVANVCKKDIDPASSVYNCALLLVSVFRDFGVDLARPLVTTCYNGHAATLLALAAAVCGKTDTSVYYVR